tara:strand:+ start:65 stop:316 length:252 start_codon:yes stop_codon:yes gene_type:complete
MNLTENDIRIIQIGNDDVRKLTSEEFMHLQNLMQKGRKGGAFQKATKKLNLSNGGMIKSRTGPQDFRKGGMVLSTMDKRKNRG